MEENMQKILDVLVMLRPDLVYIERYTPPEKTSGGIFLPEKERDKEARSAQWGKVLKVSPVVSEDEYISKTKEILKKGMMVSFLPANPVQGPSWKYYRFQRIGVQDILDAVDEMDFVQLEKDGLI